MSKKLKHVEETFSIRSLRAKLRLRLSYEELANKSGVDINTLKRILGGKQPARLHEAIEMQTPYRQLLATLWITKTPGIC